MKDDIVIIEKEDTTYLAVRKKKVIKSA